MRIPQIILFIAFIYFPMIMKAQSSKEQDSSKHRWDYLVPEQVKLQFAGSMGMLSAGPGWYYGKKDQWETDLFLGFIPRINNMQGHITFTVKQTYSPFKVGLKRRIIYEPLTAGIYINKIFGPYFWDKLPEKYPRKYYFWATNTRFNVFIGQAVALKRQEATQRYWSFFYEINTNDLYFLSAISNRMIKATDIINLSFGFRYRFNN